MIRDEDILEIDEPELGAAERLYVLQILDGMKTDGVGGTLDAFRANSPLTKSALGTRGLVYFFDVLI